MKWRVLRQGHDRAGQVVLLAPRQGGGMELKSFDQAVNVGPGARARKRQDP
jgi:hypothetical protein